MPRARFVLLTLAAWASRGAAWAATDVSAGDNSERLPFDMDSWIALAIIIAAVAIAWALNHAAPRVRVWGTLLAATACFAVAGWFALQWNVVEHPKAPAFPPDQLKPALLTLQAATALIAGLVLLFVAVGQGKRSDRLDLPLANEASRYGRLSRYLHWITAILFLALLPMGLFASMIPEDVWFRQGYYVMHKTIGFTVLALVLVRLVWNAISPRPKLDTTLSRWKRGLAHTAHTLLYFLMIAFPVTGFVMSTYGGKLSHFFVWDIPLLWAKDMTAVIPWAIAHKVLLPYLAFVVIAAHVLGALKHQFIDKHGAFRRMVT